MIKRLLIFLSLICIATPASTHPHVWVDTKLTLLGSKDKITGFRIKWGFDEFYSTIFLTEADVNGNKILDPEEVKSSVDAVFYQEQKELYPFFFMKPGGEDKTFTLKNADVYMENGKVFYKFDLIFDEPQALKGKHEFGIYDPEFYVNFEQDIKIIVPEKFKCSQNLAVNKNISIYYDLVNPETYSMTCL